MSQSPITTSPVKTTDEPDSSPLNATPITTIHPSFSSALNPKSKKSTAQRPKIAMKSTAVTPKSKKKPKTSSSSVSKKSSKAKKSKSKPIHTMQELYVDDLTKGNAESNVEASNNDDSELNVEEGNSDFVSETLDTQKGVTGDDTVMAEAVDGGIVQDSPNAEETLNNPVVEDAPNSVTDTIPKPNVVPDVETSLAHEEPTSGTVGVAIDTDEQVDEEPVNDETDVQQDNEAPVGDDVAENTTNVPTADNVMSVDDDVVDVEAMADLDQTISEVASGSIARRLRNRKGKDADVVADAVIKATPSKKKKMIGPSRSASKVEIASQKKKTSKKRKHIDVGDSDYEVEEDMPHIASNIVSSAKKKSQKKFRRAATVPDHDVVDDVPNIVSTGKKKIGGKIIPQNVPDVPMDNISFHFIDDLLGFCCLTGSEMVYGD
ncbi:hypothetical protein QL285_065199 [Trifolium repens]|nr:hypothetical protein QL285_065199 [Trifolium repens]